MAGGLRLVSDKQAKAMVLHAEEYLESAFDDRDNDPPRRNVAYENARTAAELAGKALLLITTGDYPSKGGSGHNIGGLLQMHGLIPLGCDPKRLSRLLKHRGRADYGFMEPVDEDEMEEAIDLADRLLVPARRSVGL